MTVSKREQVVIYLHGFLSSPQSVKAQQTKAFVEEHYPDLTFYIPQLDNHPKPAAKALDELIAQHPNAYFGFIGSSMGGYFSSYLLERYGGKAVLINPAVQPYNLLADYLGEHVNPYTKQKFSLDESHTRDLTSFDTKSLASPQNYWVLLQTADETLDYRQAEKKYMGAKLTIEEGGDHSFQGYERFLKDIFQFLLHD
ncbi:YqiA/YcfP family alpha/beta fold hydrolase [Paraglaciecola chathamensis]|uniref:YqiA/YcfP family alpha/beta fold hydrolase n=1 Tax=Paraglaciecola chathamensis TaxID=368405 RepID=UPI00270DC096|nr:YqiA/YcfP family alpha/beta fold hydrolase [Paraglaciecola chathamensis]MDO6839979.1 YqiA/YcfP family alpha/beta fold hydrolase [Paraglaciecola chathamensis]